VNNRENLLDSALHLFALRGYDAVGVQEVADAAHLKKPTLYHYFGSKSGLLRTLLEESFTPLFESLEQSADYQHDVTMTLRAVATTYFDFARRNPLLYRMHLSMWFAPPDSDPFKVVAALNERQQQMMETLFLRAAEDHGNMKGRHRAYASTFLGMVNTYISLALNDHIELDDVLVYQAVHQFMHGIFS
jgi:TetR/AcrR family transcriptional regulator